MAEFSAGDVVRLKSGGPHMTVSSYEDDGFGEMRVYTVWFDEKNNEKSGSYNPATLVKVDQGGGSSGGAQGGGGPNSWMS